MTVKFATSITNGVAIQLQKTYLQKSPKNVGDLGKLIVVKSCPKSNKSPNLVTLVVTNACEPSP